MALSTKGDGTDFGGWLNSVKREISSAQYNSGGLVVNSTPSTSNAMAAAGLTFSPLANYGQAAALTMPNNLMIDPQQVSSVASAFPNLASPKVFLSLDSTGAASVHPSLGIDSSKLLAVSGGIPQHSMVVTTQANFDGIHLHQQQQQDNTTIEPLRCNLCKQPMASKEYLIVHMAQMHTDYFTTPSSQLQHQQTATAALANLGVGNLVNSTQGIISHLNQQQHPVSSQQQHQQHNNSINTFNLNNLNVSSIGGNGFGVQLQQQQQPQQQILHSLAGVNTVQVQDARQSVSQAHLQATVNAVQQQVAAQDSRKKPPPKRSHGSTVKKVPVTTIDVNQLLASGLNMLDAGTMVSPASAVDSAPPKPKRKRLTKKQREEAAMAADVHKRLQEQPSQGSSSGSQLYQQQQSAVSQQRNGGIATGATTLSLTPSLLLASTSHHQNPHQQLSTTSSHVHQHQQQLINSLQPILMSNQFTQNVKPNLNQANLLSAPPKQEPVVASVPPCTSTNPADIVRAIQALFARDRPPECVFEVIEEVRLMRANKKPRTAENEVALDNVLEHVVRHNIQQAGPSGVDGAMTECHGASRRPGTVDQHQFKLECQWIAAKLVSHYGRINQSSIICEWCKESINAMHSGHLLKHMARHLNLPLFVCRFCNGQFEGADKHAVMFHCEAVHKREPSPHNIVEKSFEIPGYAIKEAFIKCFPVLAEYYPLERSPGSAGNGGAPTNGRQGPFMNRNSGTASMIQPPVAAAVVSSRHASATDSTMPDIFENVDVPSTSLLIGQQSTSDALQAALMAAVAAANNGMINSSGAVASMAMLPYDLSDPVVTSRDLNIYDGNLTSYANISTMATISEVAAGSDGPMLYDVGPLHGDSGDDDHDVSDSSQGAEDDD